MEELSRDRLARLAGEVLDLNTPRELDRWLREHTQAMPRPYDDYALEIWLARKGEEFAKGWAEGAAEGQAEGRRRWVLRHDDRHEARASASKRFQKRFSGKCRGPGTYVPGARDRQPKKFWPRGPDPDIGEVHGLPSRARVELPEDRQCRSVSKCRDAEVCPKSCEPS